MVAVSSPVWLQAAGYAVSGIGTVLLVISALGLLRLPDVYNQVNAVAKAATLGVICVLLGVLAVLPTVATAVVVGLAGVLQLVTTPIGAYALGRAAFRSGVPFAPGTDRADLREEEAR